MQAKIQRIEEARATFKKAQSEGRSAALLTQHRPNMFTQDIANLMPGLPIKVTLTYAQTVPRVDGAYELVVPLVVGPRYQPQGAGVAPVKPRAAASSTGTPKPTPAVRPVPTAKPLTVNGKSSSYRLIRPYSS
ncbi:MAG: hypothetical protein IPG29_13005 [Sphingobacteriales bacterium]|nr:hypothetical protein [Sphingobacteriales bacterium]